MDDERKAGNRLIDLTDLRFGALLVVEQDKTKLPEKKRKRVNGKVISRRNIAYAYWRCLCSGCDCMVSVRSDILRNGDCRMCDMCRYEMEQNRRARLKKIIEIDVEGIIKKRFRRRLEVCPPEGIRVSICESFNSPRRIKKAGPLRDEGMSITDIMDLLNCSRESVVNELKHYRALQDSYHMPE